LLAFFATTKVAGFYAARPDHCGAWLEFEPLSRSPHWPAVAALPRGLWRQGVKTPLMSLWAGAVVRRVFLAADGEGFAAARANAGDSRTGVLPGAIIGNLWQQPFYPNIDAFSAMARGIPETIQSCFGKDVRSGFNARPLSERKRREAFSTAFEPFYAEPKRRMRVARIGVSARHSGMARGMKCCAQIWLSRTLYAPAEFGGQ